MNAIYCHNLSSICTISFDEKWNFVLCTYFNWKDICPLTENKNHGTENKINLHVFGKYYVIKLTRKLWTSSQKSISFTFKTPISMLVGENINSFISIKRLDSNFNRFFEVAIILTITKLQHFEKKSESYWKSYGKLWNISNIESRLGSNWKSQIFFSFKHQANLTKKQLLWLDNE